MIISHKHKFIFLKTTKTAGTSIELALSRYCHTADVITDLSEEDEVFRPADGLTPRNYMKKFPGDYSFKELARWLLYSENRQRGIYRFGQHSTAENVKKEVGEKIWNSYFKFCFERNPWEKTVSAYFFHLYFTNEKISFPDFVRTKSFYNTSYIYLDKSGHVMVDYIARFENLHSELKYISDVTGIPFDGVLPKAKTGIRPEKKHYSEYYDDETIRIVGEKCRNVIELLGYKFETVKK